MKIEVTQDDIESGTRYSASWCPVALAITRSLHRDDEPEDVHVCEGTKQIQIGELLLPMPDHVVTFARRFDGGEPVEPFAFELEMPS